MPDCWAVAVELVDGQTCSFGDDSIDFSMQSCARPLVYCMALEEIGSVGVIELLDHK